MEGVEVKTHTEKLNDYAVVFKRNAPGITLTLQLGRMVWVAENLDWTEAHHFIQTDRAGMDAVIEKTKAEIELQHVGMLTYSTQDEVTQRGHGSAAEPRCVQVDEWGYKVPWCDFADGEIVHRY